VIGRRGMREGRLPSRKRPKGRAQMKRGVLKALGCAQLGVLGVRVRILGRQLVCLWGLRNADWIMGIWGCVLAASGARLLGVAQARALGSARGIVFDTLTHVSSSIIELKQGLRQDQRGLHTSNLSYHLLGRRIAHRQLSFQYEALLFHREHGQSGTKHQTFTRQEPRSSSEPTMPPLHPILIHRAPQARTPMTVDAIDAIVTPARIHKIRISFSLRKSRFGGTADWNVPVATGASGAPCACVQLLVSMKDRGCWGLDRNATDIGCSFYNWSIRYSHCS